MLLLPLKYRLFGSRSLHFVTLALLGTAAACGDADLLPPIHIPVAAVEVAPEALTLGIDETRHLTATLRSDEGRTLTGRPIAWSSSDTAVAAVSESGVVRARRGGSATVTATSEGRAGSAVVTVNHPVPALQTLSPSSAPAGGESFTLTVSGTGFAPGARVLWNGEALQTTRLSATELRAQVGAAALAEQGSAQVVVENPLPGGGTSAALTFGISAMPVASVTVSPATLELNLGTQQVLEAVLRGANGTVLTGRAVAWSSSNASVASVDVAGRVTAHAQGSATITAASEGRAATASVTVRDVPAADLLHDSPGQDESHLFRIHLGSGTLSAHSVRIDMSAANDRQAYHPTASPDGSRIAFHNHVLGIDAIFVVNRDGTGLQRLTWMEGRSDAPAWSPVPGANRIAFRHYSTESNRSDIWVMDANGANPRNLTAHLPAGEGRFDPAWSPDGQWIAFAVTRSNGNIQGIWIIRADGTGAREVTSGMNSHANFPSWSPDGRQIAYTRFFYPYSDIVILNVETGAERRIARERHQRSPSWSPDGRHIAFTEDGAVHVMRPDGTQVERIRKGPRDAFRVSWIRRP